MDRHELDRGYPERREMPERRLGGEPKVGASQVFRYRLVELREASDVQLVNQRLVPRGAQRPIVTPGERRVDDGTERGERLRCRDRRRSCHPCPVENRRASRPSGPNGRRPSRRDP